MKTLFRDVNTEIKKMIPVPVVWGRERLDQETPENVIFVDFMRGEQSVMRPASATRTFKTKAFEDEIPFAVEIHVRSNKAGATADDHETLALNVKAQFMITLRAVARTIYRTEVREASWSWPQVEPGSSGDGAKIEMIVKLPASLVEAEAQKLGGLGPAITVAIMNAAGTELENNCVPPP